MRDGLATEQVRRGDVITHMDGTPLANDGTVSFRAGGGRISYSYLLSQKFVGEGLRLKLLREGQPRAPLEITLNVHALLVPESSVHRKVGQRCPDLRLPSYCIVGGLVFVPLCEPYLQSEYGHDFDAKAPIKLLDKWQHGLRDVPGAQVVLLSQVLAHVNTVGYEQHVNQIVRCVNGEVVVSLQHLAQVVAAAQAAPSHTPFITFELEPHDEMVVLETATLAETTAELLANHQIPHDRSADLRRSAAADGDARAGASSSASQPRAPRRKR